MLCVVIRQKCWPFIRSFWFYYRSFLYIGNFFQFFCFGFITAYYLLLMNPLWNKQQITTCLLKKKIIKNTNSYIISNKSDPVCKSLRNGFSKKLWSLTKLIGQKKRRKWRIFFGTTFNVFSKTKIAKEKFLYVYFNIVLYYFTEAFFFCLFLIV